MDLSLWKWRWNKDDWMLQPFNSPMTMWLCSNRLRRMRYMKLSLIFLSFQVIQKALYLTELTKSLESETLGLSHYAMYLFLSVIWWIIWMSSLCFLVYFSITRTFASGKTEKMVMSSLKLLGLPSGKVKQLYIVVQKYKMVLTSVPLLCFKKFCFVLLLCNILSHLNRPAYLYRLLAGHANFGPQSRFPDFREWCTNFGRWGGF